MDGGKVTEMNAFLSYTLDQSVIEGLEQTITASTIETFDQIFGHKLSFGDAAASQDTDVIVANVEFWESFETFSVFFIFEKALILSLIRSIYDEQTLRQDVDEICKDTVCELANIIGNKIKYYINQMGYSSVMEIPTAEVMDTLNPSVLSHRICVSFCSSDIGDRKNVIYVGLNDAA